MRRTGRVNKRPAYLTWEEAVFLTALGGKQRLTDTFDDIPKSGRVVVDRVLCWWCRTYHHPDEVTKCMALERPKAATGEGSTSCSIVKMPPWLLPYPRLWEFLSTLSYSDKTSRLPGRISLGLSSEGIQMTLTDPSACVYCSRHFKSLDEGLAGLEEGLRSGMLTWRASGPPKGKKSR